MIASLADLSNRWSVQDKLDYLEEILRRHTPLMVAYSGGVDSTFLLVFARRLLGKQLTMGVLADSPSLPRAALEDAVRMASEYDLPLRVVKTDELENPAYQRNGLDRCYHCKSTLFAKMDDLAKKEGFAALAYGENADDALMVRPGQRAAGRFRVLAPLRDAGLTKAEIRCSSRGLGLPTYDKPAQPCLSSRVGHGIPVTRETLHRVETAEAALRQLGFVEFRVRHRVVDGEEVAVICVVPEEFVFLESVRDKAVAAVKASGYRRVRVDEEGYRPPARKDPTVLERELDNIISIG
ncbi:MAG: ATP-dependent sacrificial sulfur transferase LarE [Verrucomicrobiia bacterium]